MPAPTIVNQFNCNNADLGGGPQFWFGPPVGGFTPSAGNILVLLCNERDVDPVNGPIASFGGWTVLESLINNLGGGAIAWKVSDGTEQFAPEGLWVHGGVANGHRYVVEIAGGDKLAVTHSGITGSGGTMTGAPVSNPAGRSVLTLAVFGPEFGSDIAITPSAPFSTLIHLIAGATGNPMTIGQRSEAAGTGTNTPVATWGSANNWTVAAISIPAVLNAASGFLGSPGGSIW